MQLPPITFTDVSLLLAVGAIILLITAELSSPTYGLTNLTIKSKRLKKVAIATGTLFLITVVIQIVNIITGA